MKVLSKTDSMIVVEDDGGFINFIPVAQTPNILTLEEQEELNKKLDELEIFWF